MDRKQKMTELEKQIADGEKWLAENKGKPSYERGSTRYYQRIQEWCWLDLHSQEEDGHLLTPEETAALLESRANVQAVMI